MREPSAVAGRDSVVIDRIGAQGDGVADTAAGAVFLPFALPGEVWPHPSTAKAPGSIVPLSDVSPQRIAPVCRHFGTCGGCVAQHMAPAVYGAWKRGIVLEAFRHRGIDAVVAPLHAIAPRSRRRATFTARRSTGGVALGYLARASHDLCDVTACPVLAPQIEVALPRLKDICGRLLTGSKPPELRITVTWAKHGLDVTINGAVSRLGAQNRIEIIGLAQQARIQRLLIDGEAVLAGPSPVIGLTSVDVALPETAFLQAVPQAEAELVRLVVDAMPALTKKAAVADLFCGLGTFTFALARSARVAAFDGDGAAVAALAQAARHLQGAKPIEARRRDLFREPLSLRELQGFAAVVLDPPRAGAAAQVAELAKSSVDRVVMVSCNPATLARDCRILIDGGYHLGLVTPIDQFLYSAHVEAVAVLTK